MRQIHYDLKGSPALARAMADRASANGVRTTANDDPCLPIHYPTVNLSTFLQGEEEWVSVSHGYSAHPDDFLRVGEGIGQAIAASDKRVVLIASGSMSHRFWSFREIPLHEASDPIHISSPAAREADYERLAWFAEGNHAKVIDTMPDYLRPRARSAVWPLSDDGSGLRWTRLESQRSPVFRLRKRHRHQPGPRLVRQTRRRVDLNR